MKIKCEEKINEISFCESLFLPFPDLGIPKSLLAAMADYFDEMGWEPVALEETQRHQIMLMVRALLDHGFFPDDMLQEERLAPPASKEVVRNLPERKPTPEDESCSICLKPNTEHPDIFKILPCSHEFHQSCILPWLNQVRIFHSSWTFPGIGECNVIFLLARQIPVLCVVSNSKLTILNMRSEKNFFSARENGRRI